MTRRLHSQRIVGRVVGPRPPPEPRPQLFAAILRRTLILGLSTGYRLTRIAPARLARDRQAERGTAASAAKKQMVILVHSESLSEIIFLSEIVLPRLRRRP